jgi:hypothetical protein
MHVAGAQVRNGKGQQMLDAIRGGLETAPVMEAGDRRQFVLQTALADDEGKMGRAPNPMPRWLGNILAWVLEKVRCWNPRSGCVGSLATGCTRALHALCPTHVVSHRTLRCAFCICMQASWHHCQQCSTATHRVCMQVFKREVSRCGAGRPEGHGVCALQHRLPLHPQLHPGAPLRCSAGIMHGSDSGIGVHALPSRAWCVRCTVVAAGRMCSHTVSHR